MPASNYPSPNIYLGLPDIVTNFRLCPENSFWSFITASLTVYNFKDLGVEIIGYTGAGMPPIVNQTTPYALIGGDYYQRTITRPRVLTLLCYIQGANLREIQLKRKTLISLLAPDTSTQQAPGTKLRYALTNNAGDVIGNILELACNYVGGLEGNVDNLSQERFSLQFIEYAPPSIKEIFISSTSLNYQNSIGTNRDTYIKGTNGAWTTPFAAGVSTAYQSVFDEVNDLLWVVRAFATTGEVRNETGTVVQAVSGGGFTPFCVVLDVSRNPYVGGSFTSPQNYIMRYNGTSWVAVGATINGQVSGLAWATNGDLYAVGQFTAPGNRAGKWNGSAWSALTGGANLNNVASCVARGLDGNMYIGGSFTTADGTTVNRITKYDVTAGAYSALPSSGTVGVNSDVFCVAVGPDGRIYIGGGFTSAGGITCNRVAVWNGTAWQPLGPGLNGSVNGISVDNQGVVYVAGSFTGLSDGSLPLPDGVAKWTGTNWLPLDIDLISTGANGITVNRFNNRFAITRSASTAIASANTTVTNGGTANATPNLVFAGPGQLYSITNVTTGKSIYFNYLLLNGEQAVLNCDPTNLSFTSNFFGNVLGRILPGSDLANFGLAAGTNIINLLISGTVGVSTAGTNVYWQNTHWSFDAGVS